MDGLKEIALRYGNSSLNVHGTSYDDTASNQWEFRTVDARRPRIIAARASGRMINGRAYSHLLHSYKEHTITIGADEAEYSFIVPFLESFWAAERKFISRYNGLGFDNYIEVITYEEQFPLSEIDGDFYLPEITITLTEVN